MEKGNLLLGNTEVTYAVSRSPRRKRSVALAIEPQGHLRITAPMRMQPAVIERVIRRHALWVVRRLENIRKIAHLLPQDFTDGETISYLGFPCRLRITHDAFHPQGCRLRKRCFEINIPGASADLKHDVRLELILWYKKRARRMLQRRLDFWAGKMNLKYRRFAVSNPQKRWGSCSADNDIRLNWRLLMAPLAVVDYVAAHELSHVRHKNHSHRFWKLLEIAMPDYRARRKWLRDHEPALEW